MGSRKGASGKDPAVSETLARMYLKQGHVEEARKMYALLGKPFPQVEVPVQQAAAGNRRIETLRRLLERVRRAGRELR